MGRDFMVTTDIGSIGGGEAERGKAERGAAVGKIEVNVLLGKELIKSRQGAC
jgi:hypothetical protein